MYLPIDIQMMIDCQPTTVMSGELSDEMRLAEMWSTRLSVGQRLSDGRATRKDYETYVSAAMTSHMLFPHDELLKGRVDWAQRKWEASACHPRKHKSRRTR